MQGHKVQTGCVLQVLYRLDVARLAVQHITCSRDIETLEQVVFSRCGSLILALWHNYADDDSRFEVHDCSGQRVAQFREPVHAFERQLALTAGNRVAAARSQDFSVWDMRSGQLVGTRGPETPAAQTPAGGRAGLIVANKAASKLAFCARGSTAVHLYEAATLEALGVVHPAGEGLLARLAAQESKLCRLGWGVGGWVMHLTPAATCGTCYVRLRAGGEYEEVLGQAGGEASLPALSPDGVFMGMVSPSAAAVGVHDTRSGQLLSTMAVTVPEAEQGQEPHTEVALWWSTCGHRLLVRITSVWDFSRLLERIQVVQF